MAGAEQVAHRHNADEGDRQEHRGRPRPERGHREPAQQREVTSRAGASTTSQRRPHQPGPGGERQAVVQPVREQDLALRHERDDRRGEEPDATITAAQLERDEVRERDTHGGERDVLQPHEQQPAVGPARPIRVPDRRHREDVVQRRMVRHPRAPVAVVPTRRPLRTPDRRACRREHTLVDVGQVERGDLVGVGEVRRLVGLDERRLLEREQRPDRHERDDDAEQANHVRGHVPPRHARRRRLRLVIDDDHGAIASRTSATYAPTASAPFSIIRRTTDAPCTTPSATWHAWRACWAFDTPTPTSTGLSVMPFRRAPARWR